MKKITFLSVVLFLMVSASLFAQGVTTAGINGRVIDNTDTPLLGANVVAIHVPTGSKYGAITDFDGYYRITNMRSGGPYTITISYVGFEDYVQNGVNLQLGDAKRISVTLSESSNALDEVIITATRDNVFDSNKTGAATTVTSRDIANLPTVSRGIADFARITPQAQITEGDDGFSISLAGQNNRFNAIYIDGAVNNDVFGLAGSGTNGGQTGVNPFSVDAIESFQINLAPFDVRQSGFSGGSINAVTRSGSNKWQGSAYSFYRNEDLAGRTPGALIPDDGERERLDEFTSLRYGARIGGPIIKDKLFFFANFERQEDEIPQPFDFDNYEGNSSAADITNLINFLGSEFGYNPGGFESNTRTLDANTFNLRVDWNINDNHKIYVRQGVVQAENLETRNSNNRFIGFSNGSEFFDSTTFSTAIEWNSTYGNNLANNLKIGYTGVRDDRDPFGDSFPTVELRDGNGSIVFGAEPFSTANLLNQDLFTLNNNFEIFTGRHTVTLGVNLEYATVENLFFPFNFGDYEFGSVDDFINGETANVFQHGFSLVSDGTVGDNSDGSADFETFQAGFYVQDELQVTENFKVTAGIRVDVPYYENPTRNNDFNNRTIPLLEAAGKDLQGAFVGRGITPRAHIAPRLGFNWDVKNDNSTQIRGGLGVFTSRLPAVWPGGTYNNNGITGGFTFRAFFTDDPVPAFDPNVNNQLQVPAPGSGAVGGNIDLLSGDFRLPQVVKYNIAVDQKLYLWDLVASADFIYTNTITDVFYENLNIADPIGQSSGPGGRPFYSRDEIDPTYGRIILGSNTNEGDAINATITIKKPFYKGFQGSVSYSYGESNKIFDGTSSQNSSQWRNIQTVNGKNSDLPVTRSDFSLGSRFNANVSYEIEYGGKFGGKSTIGLYYEGASGRPISYIYNDSETDLLGDDSRDNALIFIPAQQGDITLVDLFDNDGNLIATPAQQWEALNRYIENNDYLSSRRGQFAERNGDRGQFNHVIDLKFLQDFYIKSGDTRHTLQLSVDIFNFTNLLNRDWGVRRFTNFGNVSPITTQSGGANPTFTFDPSIADQDVELIDDSGLQSSRWQAQIGLRYIFN